MENDLHLLHKSMKFLAYTFSISMHNAVATSEDLYNDLVVHYLENRQANKAKCIAKKGEQIFKNYWFIRFKRYLIDRYRRFIIEKKVKEKLKQEHAKHTETFKKPFVG